MWYPSGIGLAANAHQASWEDFIELMKGHDPK